MSRTHPCVGALVCAFTIIIGATACAVPQSQDDLVAINIALNPGEMMIARAKTANAAMRDEFPDSFELDSSHVPHITLAQRYVRAADLDRVYGALENVLREEDPRSLRLEATGYYYIPRGSMGQAGLVVAPSAGLVRLHERMLEAVAPYTVSGGTAAAFVTTPEEPVINQATIDYPEHFVPSASGENFDPHITLGIVTQDHFEELIAEPFERFTFAAPHVSVYQLGNFGTCRKLLKQLSADGVGLSAQRETLPSWYDGPSKSAITEFVRRVTTEGAPGMVPPAERIAVFDNDGTLWSEQPAYFQLLFAIDRVKQLAPQHPEWRTTPLFKAVLDGDMHALAESGEQGLVELIMTTHAGMTTDEFEDIVRQWITTAHHPTTGRPYTEMVYQPMLELLGYLRDNGFKTYIVSGGGIEFMRVFAEEVYGIPPEQVIGSSIETEFEMRDGTPVLVRLPKINFVNDKAGKPIGIQQHIGRRLIAAFGNSDGDLQMLQWTAAGAGPRFCLYVHHTDAEREWAYDRGSAIGRLDKGLDEARANGWTVVDMKKDWNRVFPFDGP